MGFCLYSSSDVGSWQLAFEGVGSPGVYHSPDYVRLLEQHGYGIAELSRWVSEEGQVYYPYFKRKVEGAGIKNLWDIQSSWYYGGPIVKAADSAAEKSLLQNFRQAFSEQCSQARVVSEFVRFDPNLMNHSVFESVERVDLNRETVYVDLGRSEEDIWAELKSENRTSIRKARKSGVSVDVSRSKTDIVRFVEIYEEEMSRKGAYSHYNLDQTFFEDLVEMIGNQFVLICGSVEGRMVGATLCLYDGHTAYDFLMASLPDYWDMRINNLLMFESIVWAKQHGLDRFDLQGGREGVFRFKGTFSDRRAEFYTAGIVHDRCAYDSLCASAGAPPDSQDYFPAYRKRDSN
ncbi:MAG: hypothetical protein CME19_18125 [Gemmatimonadetes bacterium]|nr:hypothetical protein [Gemmatimonadota bacterium]